MVVFNKQKIKSIKSPLKEKPKKHTILLVDDEESNVSSLSKVLSRQYNVLCAFDGQNALDMVLNPASTDDIHVIISDQRMPNLNGVDFFKLSYPVIPKTIRILLTGFTDIQTVISSINDGKIYKYITKPIEPSDLLMTVHRALQHYETEEKLLQNSIVAEEEKKKLQIQVKESFINDLKPEERKWTLNAIKGMLLCNEDVSDNEMIYLKKILDFISNKKETEILLKEIHEKKQSDIKDIKIDFEHSFEILCLLINLILADGKVTKSEFIFFSQISNCLGFSNELTQKMFKWTQNQISLQFDHHKLKQISRKSYF